jgi:hypothetical protein
MPLSFDPRPVIQYVLSSYGVYGLQPPPLPLFPGGQQFSRQSIFSHFLPAIREQARMSRMTETPLDYRVNGVMGYPKG